MRFRPFTEHDVQSLPWGKRGLNRSIDRNSASGTTTLVTTCHEGKEHSYTVATDAKVTCDGVACKTHDLEAGAKIRLTTKSDDKNIAIKIDSLKKHVDFAKA